MIHLTLSEIAEITSGTRAGPADLQVTGPASVDSRAIDAGGLFVACAGENVDGHDYVQASLDAGAAAVLASREVDAPAVIVDDPVEALAALARETVVRLKRDHGLRVVAVTGSQGKTGVKDLLAQVLANAGPTVAANGSYNNELGVPLTILRADPSTRYLVLEMGARGVGHIAHLCRIAAPDIGVVLNVGNAHLGEFGSVENIAQAKGELVESLPAGGTAILNADDPAVAAMATRTRGHVVTFGASGHVALSDALTTPRGGSSFVLTYGDESTTVDLTLLGEHQAINASAVAAAALAARMDLTQIGISLGSARAVSKMRMEPMVTPGGVTIINDAYNANPASMAAALRTLRDLCLAGRESFAVLGEMLELGAESAQLHRSVGSLVVDLGINHLVAVGAGAHQIAEGARLRSSQTAVVEVADVGGAAELLRDRLSAGDVVLVKASRAERLERVAQALMR